MRDPMHTAERVARHIIPELAGLPIYIVAPVAGSLLTRERTGCRTGLYSADLDMALQPQLEAQGRWRGPGVAIVVDMLMLSAMSANDDDAERAIVGTTLHELAHWLDREPRTETVPDHDTAYAAFLGRCDQAAAPQTTQFPFALLGHSDSWQRLACHLWYRATRTCYTLRPRYLHIGNDYQELAYLPSPGQFIDAIWDELELVPLTMPLRRLAAIKEPPEYTALWNTVLERFISAPAA